jgi:hypothetical protein
LGKGKGKFFPEAIGDRRRACMVLQQPPRRVITSEEHNDLLNVWRVQVDQARRGQEARWSIAQGLAQESAEAYEDFLESVFFYFGENARAAEKGTREG